MEQKVVNPHQNLSVTDRIPTGYPDGIRNKTG
jgi:hypothetical protein